MEFCQSEKVGTLHLTKDLARNSSKKYLLINYYLSPFIRINGWRIHLHQNSILKYEIISNWISVTGWISLRVNTP